MQIELSKNMEGKLQGQQRFILFNFYIFKEQENTLGEGESTSKVKWNIGVLPAE